MRKPLIRALFNAAGTALAMGASGLVLKLIAPAGVLALRDARLLLPLVAAAATYYAINRSLVTSVLALDGALPLSLVWRRNFGWIKLREVTATRWRRFKSRPRNSTRWCNSCCCWRCFLKRGKRLGWRNRCAGSPNGCSRAAARRMRRTARLSLPISPRQAHAGAKRAENHDPRRSTIS